MTIINSRVEGKEEIRRRMLRYFYEILDIKKKEKKMLGGLKYG